MASAQLIKVLAKSQAQWDHICAVVMVMATPAARVLR